MQGGQPAEIWPGPVYRPLLAAAAVVKAHEVQPVAGAAWWILMPSPCKSFDTGLLPAPATASVSTSAAALVRSGAGCQINQACQSKSCGQH